MIALFAIVVAVSPVPAGTLPMASRSATIGAANFPLLTKYPRPTLQLFRGFRSLDVKPLRFHVEISVPPSRHPVSIH